jgi:hypothetical protein
MAPSLAQKRKRVPITAASSAFTVFAILLAPAISSRAF